MFLAQADIFDVLQQIDRDFLGVVLIIGTVGTFITVIVSIVTVARTCNSLLLTRMQHSMVKNLLAQGYSIADVERLAYGNHRWGDRFRNLVQSAKSQMDRLRRTHGPTNQPVPPVKQTAYPNRV